MKKNWNEAVTSAISFRSQYLMMTELVAFVSPFCTNYLFATKKNLKSLI